MIKMSFIVICYNQVDDIDAVLKSIFDQNISYNYEVIVSDDGSNDGTIEKIQSWKSQYPEQLKLFIQPRDPKINVPIMERIGKSIKCALKNMSGEYFCLFDGDDYCLYNDFSNDAITIMDNDATIGSVVFNFEYRFPSETQLAFFSDINGAISHEGIINKFDFICKNYAHSGTFVFRNQLSESQIEYLTSFPFVIDNTIIPFMLQFGELYYKPKLAYSYRVSGGNWDKRTDEEKNVFTVLNAAIVANLAPEFEWAFKQRIAEYFRYVYDNRKLLQFNMNDNIFNEYNNIAKKYDGSFTYNCLNWNNIGFFRKIKLNRYYKKLSENLK